MAEYHQINLKLKAGTLQMTRREPAEEWQCSFCGEDSDQTVALHVTVDEGQEFKMNVCASCIAQGLAIGAGRAHVVAGGELKDLSPLKLQHDEHLFTDSEYCARCGLSRETIERRGAAACAGEWQSHEWSGAFCSVCGVDEASSFAERACQGDQQ